MNTLHLKYVVEVAKTGSITQAAENLYMGQPNLSRAIKELEASLGITIFERTPRGITVTEQGKAFLAGARDILSRVDSLEGMCREGRPGRPSFCVSAPRASYIAYAFTAFVSGLDPRQTLDMVFYETYSMKAINNLLEDKHNLAIIRFPAAQEAVYRTLLDREALHGETVLDYRPVAVLSERHPLAGRRSIGADELTAYIELAHRDGTVTLTPAAETGKAADQPGAAQRIEIYERGSQFDLLEGVPNTYIRTAPLPRAVLERHHLAQRPLTGCNSRWLDLLVYPEGYGLSPLDQAFLKRLYLVRDEIAAACSSNTP